MLSRVQDHVVYINKDGNIGSTLLDGFFIQLDSLINIGVLEIGNSFAARLLVLEALYALKTSLIF